MILAEKFVSQIMDEEWKDRGYKQRIAHITTILGKFLPADYKKAVSKIFELLDSVKTNCPIFQR